MSKILKSVQELWSYCLYCPVCDDVCREMSVSTGPDDKLKLIFFDKDGDILNIQCIYNRKFVITYNIDCLNNTFQIQGSEPNLDKKYCYFYIQSVCKRCDKTYACGSDLELNLKNKNINNIGVDREGVYLLSSKDKYHVTLFYNDSTMLVSKCFKEEDGTIIDDGRPCTLPMINLDFSKPRKTARRIKTMLVFS